MNGQTTWQNPFFPSVQQYNGQSNYYSNPMNQQFAMPKTSIKMVTGMDGAKAYLMGPDSSDLLLDKTGNVVYLVETDSAGFKTVKPFEIRPLEPTPVPDYASIDERISRLEEAIYDAKSDTSSTKSKK